MVLALGVTGGGPGVEGKLEGVAGGFEGVRVGGGVDDRLTSVVSVRCDEDRSISVVCEACDGRGVAVRGVELAVRFLGVPFGDFGVFGVFGVEGGSSPCAARTQRRRPFWTPRSPTGRISCRRKVKIKSISTVHRPIPLTAMRASAISSSLPFSKRSSVNRPEIKCCASSITADKDNVPSFRRTYNTRPCACCTQHL